MAGTKFGSQCITKSIVYIKENIASVDRILDILLQGDVISMSEREDIVAKVPGERVHTMIDLVLKRRAQQVFIDALKQTGQNLIVEHIMNKQKEFAGKENKNYMEPKPHTISLLSPKIAAYAPFHREQTTLWQQKNEKDYHQRKSHDEVNQRKIENLLEAKKQNEARIKYLEVEMEKVKTKERKKYRQLEKEHNNLLRENNDLKIVVEDLKTKLEARDKIIRAPSGKLGEDEVDSALMKNENFAFLELKKSQENFENKFMKEMARGHQELMKAVQFLSQKNAEQEQKLTEATEKLDSATARLNSAADKIDSRLDGNDNSKQSPRTSTSMQSSETILPPILRVGKARQNTFLDGIAITDKSNG